MNAKGCIHFFLLAAGWLAGCSAPQKLPAKQPMACPGKGTIEQAARALAQKKENLHPLKASARCILEWTDSEGKTRKETFDAQLRFVPPDCLFVRGDKFGEIRFGTNPQAFWMMVKPEIDTYWWGTRQAAEQCKQRIPFNPWNIVEALGIVQVDANWTLDWHDGYDILTLVDPEGEILQKISIRACDYQVISIESVDPQGLQSIQIQLDKYVTTEQGFSVPTIIQARHLSYGQDDASIRLELRGIELFEVDPVRAQRLFSRPSPDNYRTVYRLSSECDFVLVGR